VIRAKNHLTFEICVSYAAFVAFSSFAGKKFGARHAAQPFDVKRIYLL
jgi:hypothetical protein